MKNIDKYRELIEKEREKAGQKVGVVNGIPVNCAEVDNCKDCYCSEGHGAICSPVKFVDWLFEDAKEPEKDFRKDRNAIRAARKCGEASAYLDLVPPKTALPLIMTMLLQYSEGKNIPVEELGTWVSMKMVTHTAINAENCVMKAITKTVEQEEECEQKH